MTVWILWEAHKWDVELGSYCHAIFSTRQAAEAKMHDLSQLSEFDEFNLYIEEVAVKD